MRLVPASALVLCFSSVSAIAANSTYIGPAGGDWNNPSNWSAGVPVATAGESHWVDNGASAVINIGTAAGAGDLWIGNCCGVGSTGTLTLDGGSLTLANNLHVGNDSLDGTFILGSGTLNGAGRVLNISRGGGGGASTGQFIQNGGAGTFQNLNIGTDDAAGRYGVLAVNAGSLTFTGESNYAISDNSRATLNVGGGSLAWTQLNTGNGANSQFTVNHSGGVITGQDWIDFGRNASSAGTWNQTGGTFNMSGNIHLGLRGAGTMAISGGVFNHVGNIASVDGRFDVGESRDGNTNAQGALVVSGSGVANIDPKGGGGDWFIGKNNLATGTVLAHSGGVINKLGGSWTFVGTNSGSRGNVEVQNGGVININGGRFYLGNNGGSQGTLAISGGSFNHNSGDLFLVGGGNGAQGTLSMTGGSLNTVGHARVGENGSALVNHSAGTWTVSDWVAMSEGATASSTYNLSGSGVLRHTADGGNLGIGIRNAATVNMSGGTVHFGNVVMGASPGGETFNAIVNQTGGSFEADALALGQQNANARYNLSGGFLRANLITVGTGDVLAWGDGTLAVFSNGTEGLTDRTLNPLALSGPIVQEGRTLDVAGDLATGDGALQASTLQLRLYAADTVRYDQLAVSGNLDLNATNDGLVFNLDPAVITPTNPLEDDWATLTLVNAAAITGNFTTISGILPGAFNFQAAPGSGGVNAGIDPATLPLNTYFVEYVTTGAAAGDVLFHYHVQAVPEPGTLGLLLLGALMIRRCRAIA